MTYHPLDDLPDTPAHPSTSEHSPIVSSFPATRMQPAEVTVTCLCGRWEFFSQESVGGGVEPWGDSWDDHLTETENGDREA